MALASYLSLPRFKVSATMPGFKGSNLNQTTRYLLQKLLQSLASAFLSLAEGQSIVLNLLSHSK